MLREIEWEGNRMGGGHGMNKMTNLLGIIPFLKGDRSSDLILPFIRHFLMGEGESVGEKGPIFDLAYFKGIEGTASSTLRRKSGRIISF